MHVLNITVTKVVAIASKVYKAKDAFFSPSAKSKKTLVINEADMERY